MYCNANDTAKGRQMNNHFQHKGSKYPSWSSVIGTQIPQGVGAAWASMQAGHDEVHAIYFGDGATSSSGFHSGLTLGGVWNVPAVFVCVNNGWAISVPAARQSAARSFADKAAGYGLPGFEVDGMDVLACLGAMQSLVARARDGGGPSLLVLNAYRLMGHSSSDDPSTYRDAAEVAEWQAKDPIQRYAAYLRAEASLGENEQEQMEHREFEVIDAEIHRQEAAPAMPMRSLVEDVYAEVPPHLRRQYNDFIRVAGKHGAAQKGEGEFPL
jgi:2-oxoisovalerate dehydrogenase E1 component alpha subunit